MGEDEMAVGDGQGRVHGMNGLRVVDASIMPLIITGNLNATIQLNCSMVNYSIFKLYFLFI